MRRSATKEADIGANAQSRNARSTRHKRNGAVWIGIRKISSTVRLISIDCQGGWCVSLQPCVVVAALYGRDTPFEFVGEADIYLTVLTFSGSTIA